jgi:hypothetical protein
MLYYIMIWWVIKCLISMQFLQVIILNDMAKFKYVGATVTDKNLIHEEIKSRLNSSNVCFDSVQKLLSPRMLSKNLKMKVYNIIILPVVFL